MTDRHRGERKVLLEADFIANKVAWLEEDALKNM